jgi:prepilin-type N-terminal cleavage/methylation domain-containing protein
MSMPFQSGRISRSGFTLVEIVISMAILALLAGSIYGIVSSTISASQTAMSEQLTLRRLDSFLRVTRDAFLNLPGQGSVYLQIGRSQGGEAEQQLVIAKPQAIFGIPSLAGGSLILAARARSDGTRTMTLLKIPANANDQEIKEAMEATGMPLLPRLRKPRWTFKDSDPSSDWKEEFPVGSPRPILVRFQTQIDELPDPVEAVFFVPPIPPQVAPNQLQLSTNPPTSPGSPGAGSPGGSIQHLPGGSIPGPSRG